jgi:hypothetical protein
LSVKQQIYQIVAVDFGVRESCSKCKILGHATLFNLLTLKGPRAVMVCIDSFRLQTMTAFNEKFLQGGQGGSFFKKGVGDPNPFTVSQMPFFRSFISKVWRKNKVLEGISKKRPHWLIFPGVYDKL